MLNVFVLSRSSMLIIYIWYAPWLNPQARFIDKKEAAEQETGEIGETSIKHDSVVTEKTALIKSVTTDAVNALAHKLKA